LGGCPGDIGGLPGRRKYSSGREFFNILCRNFTGYLLLYYFIMMSVSEILFLAIVLYILYRFVANFLLPVVRATRQVREQFRNMQGNDQGGASPFNGAADPFRTKQASDQSARSAGQPGNAPGQAGSTESTRTAGKRPAAKPPADDYIDFEEIK
jgi:hypothetical protein